MEVLKWILLSFGSLQHIETITSVKVVSSSLNFILCREGVVGVTIPNLQLYFEPVQQQATRMKCYIIMFLGAHDILQSNNISSREKPARYGRAGQFSSASHVGCREWGAGLPADIYSFGILIAVYLSGHYIVGQEQELAHGLDLAESEEQWEIWRQDAAADSDLRCLPLGAVGLSCACMKRHRKSFKWQNSVSLISGKRMISFASVRNQSSHHT